MWESEGFQRTHDVKKMAYLLEQLSSDTELGPSPIRDCRVVNSTERKRYQGDTAVRETSQRTRVMLPRQNSFVKFKESANNELFITKSNDSYFEERAARLNKRVSFNFEVQSDDGDVWSPSDKSPGSKMNEFQRADNTLVRIEKRSRTTRSFKPMQSFDETIERVSPPDLKCYDVKPVKRKVSFASFVKNVQKDRKSSGCSADLNSCQGQNGIVPTHTRRNSFVTFLQNHKLSSKRPAPVVKNTRQLINRDSEGEDSVSSFTTVKRAYIKSDQNNTLHRPPPLINPKPRRDSSRTSVIQIFNSNPYSRQSSSSSSASSHPASWRTSSFGSDSGYSSTTFSNQSLPTSSSGNPRLEQLPSETERSSNNISQTTAAFKRQLSQIPSNPIYEDFPDPLEILTKSGSSSSSACDIEKSRHGAVKSPETVRESRRKSSIMMKTRRFSRSVLGQISRKPRKSQTRSIRFIGVNKYKAFENLVSC